ncbi:MAG: hypothetical protein ACK5LX_05775 [Oscillospiraceae bacterium]
MQYPYVNINAPFGGFPVAEDHPRIIRQARILIVCALAAGMLSITLSTGVALPFMEEHGNSVLSDILIWISVFVLQLAASLFTIFFAGRTVSFAGDFPWPPPLTSQLLEAFSHFHPVWIWVAFLTIVTFIPLLWKGFSAARIIFILYVPLFSFSSLLTFLIAPSLLSIPLFLLPFAPLVLLLLKPVNYYFRFRKHNRTVTKLTAANYPTE